MSLPLAAQHLSRYGRHGDNTLVHVSHSELAGLDALARSKGSHLTINPQTGLPEAFNLGSILKGAVPLIAGVGLTAMGMPAPLAAGLVGGVTGLATGSLQKGLMAGLGAYGGAGIANGLSSMVASQALAQESAANIAAAPADAFASTAASNAAPAVASAAPWEQASGAAFNTATKMPQLDAMKSGLSQLGTGQGWSALGNAMGGTKQAMIYGGAAAAPFLFEDAEDVPLPQKQDVSYHKWDLQRKHLRPGDPGYTPNGPYFADTWTDRGTSNEYYAAGGPIEMQSQQNAGLAALPVPGSYDVAVDPYSGAERFADGGVPTAQVQLPPQGQPRASYATAVNNMNPGATADAMQYLMGNRATSKTSPYHNLVTQAYQTIGRSNFGTDVPTVDKAGYQYWQNLLDSGRLTPQQFRSEFSTAATRDAQTTPNTAYRDYVTPMLGGLQNWQAAGAPAQQQTSTQLPSNPYNLDMSGLNPNIINSMLGGSAGLPKFTYNPQTKSFTQGYAGGGLPSLGGYSDGGQLLKGPGTGLSDDIPAQIGSKQPARLADGEFVVSADVVSALGGGSTDAGAKQLYSMMDRVRQQAHGNKQQVKPVSPKKVLPA